MTKHKERKTWGLQAVKAIWSLKTQATASDLDKLERTKAKKVSKQFLKLFPWPRGRNNKHR